MPTRQRYQQIVEHFEEAVRANFATLDRVADISETIHGTTPVRFAQSLRLAEARKALVGACEL